MLLPPYNFEGVGDEVVISGIVVAVVFIIVGFLIR